MNHEDVLPPTRDTSGVGRSEPKAVFFLEPDAELFDRFGAYLAAEGIGAKTFDAIADLAASLQSTPGVVLLLDTGGLAKRQSIAQLADYLGVRAINGGFSFVCVAQTDSIEQRLDAMRAGAAAFFPRPVEPRDLIAKLLELSAGAESMPSRVLVVDDSPIEAAATTGILEQSGVETRWLDAPLTLIDAALAFRPDLILMDIRMADAGGLELTRILREHDSLFSMPIVLMGAVNSDQDETRSAALCAGADDILIKPPRAAQLIEVVVHRARRVHRLCSKLAMTAERDSVTGLGNRRRLLRYIDENLQEQGVPRGGRGVLYIKVDAPDHLTGVLGFGGADALLEHVADRIKSRLGPADLAARVGDFSFAVAAERPDDATLDALAEDLCRSVSESVLDVAGTQVLVTVSIGVRRLRPPANDALALIAAAEKACTKARVGGGNRIEIHAPAVDSSQDHRADEIHALIEQALKTDGFQQLYQPVVAVRGQPGARYDALLRLRLPNGGSMHPSEFLPVAQQRGLMMKIDRWVMECALNTLAQQREADLKVEICVHQAMSTIQAKSWVIWMRDQLVKRMLVDSPPALQVALSDVLENLSVANSRFELLNKLGVRLCVAGFDDRPAALTFLETQPMSTVKLSLEMIQPENRARLVRISQRVHDLKRTVIAVGIEDPGAIGRVMECGVDFIQGDFVQPPQDRLLFDFSDSHLF